VLLHLDGDFLFQLFIHITGQLFEDLLARHHHWAPMARRVRGSVK